MTDPNIVIPVSQAPVGMGVPVLTPSSGFVTDEITALGGRATLAASAYDVDHLRAACSNLTLVRNTGNSFGASPVLKELLMETGYVHTVIREIFDDGDLTEHKGGMAIDITSSNLPAISRFLQTVPLLFSQVYYTNPDYSAESVYINNGAIVTLSTFSSVARSDQMHISSTLSRMNTALTNPVVRAAMGAAALGQFTNRDVYAVPPSTQLALHQQQGVEFW